MTYPHIGNYGVNPEDIEELENVPVRAGTELTTGETHVGGMISPGGLPPASDDDDEDG